MKQQSDGDEQIIICCPSCSQQYEIELEMLGEEAVCQKCGTAFALRIGDFAPKESPMQQTKACPYCGEAILALAKKCKHCGEFLDAELRIKDEKKRELRSNNPINMTMSFVRWFTGLPRMEGFRLFGLCKATFMRHNKEELDILFCSGSADSTPDINQVASAWPMPWVCWRFLFAAMVVTGLFILGVHKFENFLIFPGLIIVGAFTIPLTCLLLFHEMNVLRNVPLYRTLHHIVTGGIVSFLIAMTIWNTTIGKQLLSFFDAMSAGIIEEIAKFLAALFFLWRIPGRKWTIQGMLVGAAVGTGFAGFETAGYCFVALMNDGDDPLAAFYGTMAVRGIFSPFCHVAWTALSVGAVSGEIKDNKFSFGKIFNWRVLRILLFSVFLHMLWNSGLHWYSNDWNVTAWGILLSFIGCWQALLMMIQKGLTEIKTAQNNHITASN